VFATNESYKAIEMNRDGVKEECITVLRNGPDPRTKWFVETDQALREKAGTIIAFAGIIGYQDGVDWLLRALRKLIDNFGRTDLLCVVIGDGDAMPNLKQLVRELSLGDVVWFTGWVDDLDTYLRYLSTADICVDPSPSNAYNDSSTAIKLMEYMALGKPIVAFDLPEHRFTAQSAAVYAQPNDEVAFAQAIAELMDDPSRRERMGSFGRSRVEHELAWRYSVPKLVEAYRSLLYPPSVQAITSSNEKVSDGLQ
jgi:glycosyltransferase involved in cell wall biosynthesis